MSALRGLARFLYGFLVGEDALLAAAALLALALTAAIAATGAPAWWVTPVAVLAVLALSVLKASAGSRVPK
ncbi:MAG: hypothetical protein WB507_12945 [Solirubrobacterales bacterium]